jgi:hypothetical protein
MYAHYISILVLSIFLAACSKKADPISAIIDVPEIVSEDTSNADPPHVIIVDPPGTVYVDGIAYDAEGISRGPEGTYAIATNMYISKIDTSWNTDSTVISWSIMVPENENVTARWQIASGFSYRTKEKKVWNYPKQKWIYTYTLDLDKKVPAFGEIKMTFSNDITKEVLERKFILALELKKHFFDVYRTSFGMTKDEVRTNEMQRVNDAGIPHLTWNELLPTVATGGIARVWGGSVTYEYNEGKLVLVSEATLYRPNGGSLSNLNHVLEFLKAPGRPKVSWPTPETMLIEEPYSWDYEGLKITLQKREYFFNGETIKANALTYEKAN